MADVGGSNNVFDIDPPWELGADGAKVALFSELKPILTELEDGKRGSDDDEDPRFTAYSPPAHMHNVNISADDALEFPDLPHKRRGHISSSLDSSDLEVGKEFSSNDGFLNALNQYSIKNGVNYYVDKSKFEKFEANFALVIACALLMGPPHHPLSLDLKGPAIPFRYEFVEASPLLRVNMACHES
ncbi:hypothetical protein PVK06_047021 [Gossypium arboreum]|uniref:Uncharacterized protein n=1 Tax=Gossypium arboreum TaxID=29729 RepID=A0ABR0MC91_GOSAR|nr:hypothetical protein PVK06_047021 [Gossypium arboreum]